MFKHRASPFVVILLCLGIQSCVAASHRENGGMQASNGGAATRLGGTRWRLVQIQSMDDAIGTSRPADPNLYTMDLNADGTVAMRLNCNRGSSTWSATPNANSNNGSFRFGLLAMTRALCPPPTLDERIARDMGFVRSFLLKDGKLYLSLMADGGIYAWEPRGDGN